ncbi:hypothetical protein JCM19240_2608 [Vibrio maritimus]|uniref:Uncharacterized protein n=1 Tax=Vibrio maritimus TaxID=990268 RepID=A0A090TCT1_9VIBR|nr:hypothetical protein JCM19240_2608 [Vibrio maritimus]
MFHEDKGFKRYFAPNIKRLFQCHIWIKSIGFLSHYYS